MRKSLGDPVGKTERANGHAMAVPATKQDRETARARQQYHRRLEALIDGQRQVLEMISQGASLVQVLEAIVRWVEAQSHDGVLASLLLLDAEGQHLLHGAAPSLPQAYNDAIHGLQIGPAVGYCGTAAFTRRAVVVEDIAVDPRWADYRELALAHGLRACWSTPLIARSGRVLGTFAMYYRHPRRPTSDDQHIIQLVTQTAILAIEHKQAVEEHERGERATAWLAAIVTSAEDAIASKTLDGIVTSWNASAERMFGYTAEEMIGQPILRLFPPDRLSEEDMILARIRAGERIEHFETVRVTKDGQLLDVSLTISPIRESSGTIIGASKIARDITVRKRLESALRESEEKFRTLADHIPTLACMARADGYIIWYNRRWYEYTGTTPESQEGWGWQSVHDPDVLPEVMERWQQSLATGEPFEMVFPLKGGDGVFRPFLTRVQPLKDDTGHIIRWFGTSTDVSEQVRLQEELRAANERMDEFLHTATHELKTPLTALQANLQLVERRLQRLLTSPSDATATPGHVGEALRMVAQLIARSQQQVRRQTRLVNDLVDAARIQAGKLEIHPAPCDLAEVAWEAVTEQRAVRPERTIRLQLPEGQSVPVAADTDRIGQVVTNYLTNALKYSPEDRPVEVTLSVEGDNSSAAVARVSVRDEGYGIPRDEQARVWERGHRVPGIKPLSEGIGLGLGLHISREIVERHGGQVGIKSAPGKGSTFWFTLPLTPAEPQRYDRPAGSGGAVTS